MAAGLPVLASPIGGIPWMIEEGKAGLLFDPRKQREMADCLIEVLRDPALCERMGQAAREKARRRFRPDVVARETLDVYQQAIDEYGR